MEKGFERREFETVLSSAVGCFAHNSFDISNLVMGLNVLESLGYKLRLWCFEFLHWRCRDFVKPV